MSLSQPPLQWLNSIWNKSLHSSSPKFPLEQGCSCIAAVWRLAQPRLPNGSNLEGLVWPPPDQHHHHATPNSPVHAHVHKRMQIHTFPNQVDWIIDAYRSDAFVELHKSDRDCQNVCVYACLYWLLCVCLPKSPTPPSSQKTCTVPSDIHHKLHMLFFPPSLSLSFHSPRDPELTNTQTISDVKQWTRRAFRPLTLTVEGIECGRLWESHASLNRQ